MKINFFFYILLFSTSLLKAQEHPCCAISSVHQFAKLGQDLTFVMAHENPNHFELENPTGKKLSFDTPDGNTGSGYYIEGASSSSQWIFVIHEWWGLNDYIKNEAEKLHSTFPFSNILCLDMYDGSVATTREEASKLMQTANPQRLESIVKGASSYAGPKAKIASIGWCFGGGWSSKIATMLGSKMSACVIYYGMPVLDNDQLKNVHCPTLGIFADKDNWITPAKALEFKEKLMALNQEVEIYQYPAAHAFANPSNPNYDKVNAEDAWAKTIAFFQKHIH
jgi:carboxymethylenebutenolidase